MIDYLKSFLIRNWKSFLGFLGGFILWILVKENILNLSYPLWGYLVFGGISFDGTDDFVSVGTLGNFGQNLTSDFTISFWIKTTDTNTVRRLMGSTNDGTATLLVVDMSRTGTTSGSLALNIRDNGGNNPRAYADAAGINDGNTHHCVLVKSGNTASDFSIYVDGISLSMTVENAATVSGFSNFGYPVYIGTANNRGAINNPVDAEITELAIWSGISLTQSDVNNLYSHIKRIPLQIHYANLVGYWPMDDGPDGTSADGDIVRDLSGNENNGTGDDGGNNTGLTWLAENKLSYPSEPIFIRSALGFISLSNLSGHVLKKGLIEPLHLGMR